MFFDSGLTGSSRRNRCRAGAVEIHHSPGRIGCWLPATGYRPDTLSNCRAGFLRRTALFLALDGSHPPQSRATGGRRQVPVPWPRGSASSRSKLSPGSWRAASDRADGDDSGVPCADGVVPLAWMQRPGLESPAETFRRVFWLTLIPGALPVASFALLVSDDRRRPNPALASVLRYETSRRPFVATSRQ